MNYTLGLLFLFAIAPFQHLDAYEKIRWGILSTARFNDKMIDAIRKSSDSELVAIASRGLDKAQQYASQKNIPKAYGSYEELLADNSIDVIYIPLPNSLHAEWCIKAARAGKHVLCEKPFVATLKDFEDVEKAAQENNVIIFEALAYLYHPQTDKLLELIQNKKIGDITSITSWFHIDLWALTKNGLPIPDSEHFRLNPALGGGCLWDLGSYCASICTLIAQADPKQVWTSSIEGKTHVDLASSCTMKFSNNITAQFVVSYNTSYSVGLYIHGTKGTLYLDSPWRAGIFKENYITFSDFNHEEKIPFGICNPYIYEIQEMERCIRHKTQPKYPLSVSKSILKTLLACYDSAKSEKLMNVKD